MIKNKSIFVLFISLFMGTYLSTNGSDPQYNQSEVNIQFNIEVSNTNNPIKPDDIKLERKSENCYEGDNKNFVFCVPLFGQKHEEGVQSFFRAHNNNGIRSINVWHSVPIAERQNESEENYRKKLARQLLEKRKHKLNADTADKTIKNFENYYDRKVAKYIKEKDRKAKRALSGFGALVSSALAIGACYGLSKEPAGSDDRTALASFAFLTGAIGIFALNEFFMNAPIKKKKNTIEEKIISAASTKKEKEDLYAGAELYLSRRANIKNRTERLQALPNIKKQIDSEL